MSVLALIPARGGSKGLPRKNVTPFLGRPLILWTIEQALAAESVAWVVISTDDPEIAEISRGAGALVPFLRPKELAQDDTPDHPVFVHALDTLARDKGWRPEIVVHLRATTPLRTPKMIDEGVARLQAEPRADSLRAVCVPHNNPYKMWRIIDGYLEPLVHTEISEQFNQPRQKLPPAWWQTGTLDVTRTRTILEQGSMTGRRILPFTIDAAYACDIDDQFSLTVAELACRRIGFGAGL